MFSRFRCHLERFLCVKIFINKWSCQLQIMNLNQKREKLSLTLRHHEENFTTNPKANEKHQISLYIINESNIKEHENKGNDRQL